MLKNKVKVSVILPVRDEEQAIQSCVEQIKQVFKESKISGEIIVSDSSRDRSHEIAEKLGVKIVKHNKEGYGAAYQEGFKSADGKYIFMADADGSYDFRNIPKFLSCLDEGYDLVIGNRFRGHIHKGAMPFFRRYIGNPVLSSMFRLFFSSNIGDVHCGMRAMTREALEKLNLRTIGMEYASEMIIRSVNMKLKIWEVPINYYKRKGKSKLRIFSDGWRHLRFMLMFAPAYLFLVPGLMFFLLGLLFFEFLFFEYGRLVILGSFFVILGYQIISLGLYAKAYMKSTGFIESDRLLDFIARTISFEIGIYLGLVFLGASFILALGFVVFSGNLDNNTILIVLTLAVLGVQTIFSAFLLSIMLVEKK
ncbi:MAG: glycosyltransferase family 2 protein [archaeon]